MQIHTIECKLRKKLPIWFDPPSSVSDGQNPKLFLSGLQIRNGTSSVVSNVLNLLYNKRIIIEHPS